MLQSIYTHAGCDYGCLYTYSPRHCFNPHTHAGCDNVHNVSGASFPVSIHTPTQGVTFLYICNVFRICFNPHTHAGCDNPLPRLTRVHNRFNPHTHAGCDLMMEQRNVLKRCFNPHTHAGCDAVKEDVLNYINEFQSTHPRRVWLQTGLERYKQIQVSIHTPTQGVTQKEIELRKINFSFNPHTHAGCDPALVLCRLAYKLFQSTHPRRVWLYI